MGKNKAYLQRNDQSMLEYGAVQLRRAGVDRVVISGSHSGGIADRVTNGGPLGGIHAVISELKPRALLILPVDMPFMDTTTLKLLLDAGRAANKAQYFNDVSLPVYLPVTEQLTDFLDASFSSQYFIDSGRGPSLRQLFKVIGAQSVKLACDQPLINTNTPEQWQQSLTLIKSSMEF